MKNFRTRESTDNPAVSKYVFSDTENTKKYVAHAERYDFLVEKARSGIELSKDERQEMKMINREVIEYKTLQSQKIKSVLENSNIEATVGAGKDNRVVTDGGGYVYKYSVETYPPTPETVEYLVNKYKMLKKFMGEYIPDSKFILGERRIPFNKKTFYAEKKDNRSHIMTIQRRVRGKTMAAMSSEERVRPDLVEQLKISHKIYIALKNRIGRATKYLNLPKGTLDVKLDLGGLSKEDDIESFDLGKISEFRTPNIMYDEISKTLYFIDFDMNNWTNEKQKIYDLVMSEQKF